MVLVIKISGVPLNEFIIIGLNGEAGQGLARRKLDLDESPNNNRR